MRSTFVKLAVLDLRRLLAAVLLLLLLDSTFLDIQRLPFQLEPPPDDVLVLRHLAATARTNPKIELSEGKQHPTVSERIEVKIVGEQRRKILGSVVRSNDQNEILHTRAKSTEEN